MRDGRQTLSLRRGNHGSVSLLSSGASLLSSISFPGGSDGKESAFSAGDQGSISGSERCPEEGNGYPFQYSCLRNPMDRKAWWTTVCGVTNSQTRLSTQALELSFSRSLRLHGLQHARPPCPSSPPRACSNSCPLSR